MAKNFQNRIDYVDIKAYGIGKVKIDDDIDENMFRKKHHEDSDNEGEKMKNCSNPNARVFQKL